MADKKRILIISFSDIKRDPRVFRQVKHLASKYDVITLGFGDPEIDGVRFIPIREIGASPLKKVRRAAYLKMKEYEKYYEATFDAEAVRVNLREEHFDLVIANDSDSLPLVFSWEHGAPVLHDAHEYAPRQIEDRWWWRFLMKEYMEWICATYLKRCKAVTTVSEGIAKEYSMKFGVLPTVITNAPDYVDIRPSPVEEGKVRMVHTGNANPSRRIEKYLELMAHLDERFTLDLYLMPRDPAYLKRMRNLAESTRGVRILDPVPMQDLIPVCNRYDVGIFFQEPLNFNLEHSLPNKFFEFVQARLAVAITPLPEMKATVRSYGIGLVAPDFEVESMASLLSGLDKAQLEHFKSQAEKAAHPLSSEVNMGILGTFVDELIR